MTKFANVYVDISYDKLDKVFQYRIPEGMEVFPGLEVIVPFGMGNKPTKGIVTGITDSCDFDESKIKAIDSIASGSIVIESKLIALAAYIKETCGGTMNEALRAVLPVTKEVKRKINTEVVRKVSADELSDYIRECTRKKSTAKARLAAELLSADSLDKEAVTGKLHISPATLNAMVRDGVIDIVSKEVYRDPVKGNAEKTRDIVLNKQQEQVVNDFLDDYNRGQRGVYLIHGVTGSGKTEVYMSIIEEVIKQGKQVIFLIPEIALTFQMVKRFKGRFGNRVSILNSRMSAGERYDQYLRSKEGDIDIIIGPRSALFTPFANLGLIIMDEEHEGSYKSEKTPKYHTRNVAIKRGQMEGAAVILGSATPSLETTKMAEDGLVKRYFLNERAGKGEMPDIYVADLKEEIKAKNRSIFSRKLKELMEDRLAKGEQIMLFLNRRGYAGFVSCRSCGHVMKCPHCDVSLNYHKNGTLMCHYCGYTEKMPEKCPECGSPYIAAFGLGTEKVEEFVKKEFPSARTLRMDADTTAGKDGHEKILSAFANGEADILIGTQMIVKGHDFEKVSLVGILAADLSLFANDYLASEKTFQLLVQASGRAGRGRYKGDVVVQTYHPEHYCVEAAAKSDYFKFYDREMLFRRLSGYPPYVHLLAVVALGKKEDETENGSNKLYEAVKDTEGVRCGKAVWAAVAKINDIYRRVIYIRSEDMERLIEVKNRLEAYARDEKELRNVSVQFDFDPRAGY